MNARSRILACCLAAALMVGCTGLRLTASAEERPPIPVADSRGDIDWARLYDSLVGIVEQRFFDEAALKQADWRARAAAARASVLSAPSPADAVRQINALLAELKTSHTALLTPDEYQYYFLLDIVGAGDGSDLMSRRFWGTGPYYPGTGAFTQEIDGRHFVDGVLEGSPADRAGLKYGDEILSVDGMPYSPIAAFRDKIGKTVELKVRRSPEAEPQLLQVEVIAIRPTKAFSDATETSARVIERDGKRIGYVHIWALHESDSLKEALAKLGSTAAPALDSLIVDLRGRVGGRLDVAGQALELLDVRRPYWGNWRAIGRSPRAARAARNRARPVPSVLLIDHQTRSAGEIMAYGYQRSAFGTVLGTPTAGAVSSGTTFVMPGDLLLYVAIAGHEFDGRRLEGVGVIPDRRVERPLPYAGGADPVLDAAVDLLTKQPPK